MKPTLLLLVSSLCLLLLGCATVQKPKQPTYQDLAKESLGLMDDLAASMASMSDPKSAATATQSMKGIMEQMGSLSSRMKGLDKPPAEFQEMFQKQMLEKQGAIAKSMMSSMMGLLSNPELAQNLNGMMNQLRQLSTAIQP